MSAAPLGASAVDELELFRVAPLELLLSKESLSDGDGFVGAVFSVSLLFCVSALELSFSLDSAFSLASAFSPDPAFSSDAAGASESTGVSTSDLSTSSVDSSLGRLNDSGLLITSSSFSSSGSCLEIASLISCRTGSNASVPVEEFCV